MRKHCLTEKMWQIAREPVKEKNLEEKGQLLVLSLFLQVTALEAQG
jgi:hypothetical protein